MREYIGNGLVHILVKEHMVFGPIHGVTHTPLSLEQAGHEQILIGQVERFVKGKLGRVQSKQKLIGLFTLPLADDLFAFRQDWTHMTVTDQRQLTPSQGFL